MLSSQQPQPPIPQPSHSQIAFHLHQNLRLDLLGVSPRSSSVPDPLDQVSGSSSPMTDSSDGVIDSATANTATTGTSMLGPDSGSSQAQDLAKVSANQSCSVHQHQSGFGDKVARSIGESSSSSSSSSSGCILCRLVDLSIQQKSDQENLNIDSSPSSTITPLLLLSPTNSEPALRSEDIAYLYTSPSLSPISAGSVSPLSSLCSQHPASSSLSRSPSFSPSLSPSPSPSPNSGQQVSVSQEEEEDPHENVVSPSPRPYPVCSSSSPCLVFSSSCPITVPAGPSASPPSVVISDHSLAEQNELDEQQSQAFSRTKSGLGYRLRQQRSQQQQQQQKSQQTLTQPQDLQSFELPNQLLRRDSVASICSSTSSLSSLGEDDCIALESAILTTESTTTTTDDGLMVTCRAQPPAACSADSSSHVASASSSSSSSSNLLEPAVSSSSRISTSTQTSPWRKVRSLVTSPFMQTYKRQRYPWIQLAGHQGNFQSGKQPGTILKKSSGNERLCFEMLMRQDSLMDYVPRYFGEVLINQQVYLQLQDLLADFVNPCIMDVKMGVRTYLEDELIKAGEKPKLRKDMYEKMVAIDPAEPTAQEHAQRAITKPRYMVWRETISSTSTLAYRIDGIKLTESGLSDGSVVANSGGGIGGGGGATAAAKDCAKDFKRIKSECDVRCAIHQFTANRAHCIPKYRNKLATIRAALTNSNFFWGHELIGSSLLFVHDEIRADIWLIDFAKSYPLPGDCPSISHQSEWKLGNHEDGYLTGFDNLATLFGTL